LMVSPPCMLMFEISSGNKEVVASHDLTTTATILFLEDMTVSLKTLSMVLVSKTSFLLPVVHMLLQIQKVP